MIEKLTSRSFWSLSCPPFLARSVCRRSSPRAVSAVGYALMQRLHHKRLVVAVRCIPCNRQRSMLLRLREALGLDVAVPTPQPLQELVV